MRESKYAFYESTKKDRLNCSKIDSQVCKSLGITPTSKLFPSQCVLKALNTLGLEPFPKRGIYRDGYDDFIKKFKRFRKFSIDKVSYMRSNVSYEGQILNNCIVIDINNAYPFIVFSNKVPVEYLASFENYIEYDEIDFKEDETCIVYETKDKHFYFDFEYNNMPQQYRISKTHFFKTGFLNHEYFKKMINIMIRDQYSKSFAKKMMNAYIGMLVKTPTIITEFIWAKQKERMEQIDNKLRKKNYDIVFSNTDSFCIKSTEKSIPLDEFLDISPRIGDFKIEKSNAKMKYFGFNKYIFEGSRPKLAGYKWDMFGDGDIVVNGKRMESSELFYKGEKGDKIDCLSDNVVVKKEL